MESFRPDLHQYIENHIIKSKCIYDDLEDCWLWTGGKFATSYATDVSYGAIRPFSKTGQKYQAHRISYQLFKGELKDDQMLLHSCDTKSCVNPNHLEIGTPSKNMLDYHRRYLPHLSKKLSTK